MSLLLLFGGGTASLPDPGTDDFPGIAIEIAFGYTWRDASPTWTDVTDYVRFEQGISVNLGRPDELSDPATGTLSFTLENRDRRFDPTYAAGPYFGDLLPAVPVRIRVQWDDSVYNLAYGFAEGWPQESRVANEISNTEMVANDATELLAQADYSGGVWTLDDDVLGLLDAGNRIGGGEELARSSSSERIDIILDLVGWPEALRDIDTGVAELSADLIDGPPIDALNAVVRAEDGWGHFGPDNVYVFRARHADHTNASMSTSQGSFTDADFSLPYAGLRFNYDRRYVYNHVIRQTINGAPQVASDSASQDLYFRREHSLTDVPLESNADALALAERFLYRHKDPALRPVPMVIAPGNNRTTLFPQVLGRRLLDRISLSRTPQGIGSAITADWRIEGIQHRIGPGTWETTWSLSPVDDTTYWTLDDDALGLLDSGNLVGA